MERDLDYHKTLADKQADVEGAQARRSVRISIESCKRHSCLFEKRLKHMYETGAIDAELDRIVAESERDVDHGKANAARKTHYVFSRSFH